MADELGQLFEPEDDSGLHLRGEGDDSDLDPLVELPAPSSPDSANEPAQAPINLADLDLAFAKERLQAPIGTATSFLPHVDGGEIQALAEATLDRVVARSKSGSKEAISISELAEKTKIDSRTMGERFEISLPPLADLVTRLIHAQTGQRVYYEEVCSHSAIVSRRHNGVGTDRKEASEDDSKRSGRPPKSLHMLDNCLGTANKHCPSVTEPLTTGTRWDIHDPRYGINFPRWMEAYRGHIPSSLSEHLENMLGVGYAARAHVVPALKRGDGTFMGNITPERLVATLSQYLVIAPVPFGAPDVPYRDHAGVLLPGRDEATVEVARRSKRRVILGCGEASNSERIEFEERSQVLPVGKLPSMYELDIHKKHNVEYRWSPSHHELGRYEAGKGARLEIWRFVGLGQNDQRSFWRMLTVVERLSQVHWTKKCVGRWDEDCMPGMQQAHLPESCAMVRALLVIANAAIVDALRLRGLSGSGT